VFLFMCILTPARHVAPYCIDVLVRIPGNMIAMI
jgi:hypothetical protein